MEDAIKFTYSDKDKGKNGGYGNQEWSWDILFYFALSYNLQIIGAYFKKKAEHLINYKSGDYYTNRFFFLPLSIVSHPLKSI